MVIVDCKWPCTDSNSACIITNNSIKCQRKQNSQWIWIDPKKSPEYDGEPALQGEPCITIPQPIIINTNNSLIINQTTQTEVTWPPLEDILQPVDSFLSDCNQQTFCSQGICIPKLNIGESCESTNQCMENHICQYKKCTPYQPSSSSKSKSISSSSEPTSSSTTSVLEETIEENHKTIQIILGVLISLFIIGLILAIYYFYKKWYRRKSSNNLIISNKVIDDNNNSNDHHIIPIQHQHQHQQQQQHPSSNVNISSSSSSSSSSNNSPSNNIILHHHDEPSMISPSIQQQQLQFKLQNQLPYTNDPPPSYHP